MPPGGDRTYGAREPRGSYEPESLPGFPEEASTSPETPTLSRAPRLGVRRYRRNNNSHSQWKGEQGGKDEATQAYSLYAEEPRTQLAQLSFPLRMGIARPVGLYTRVPDVRRGARGDAGAGGEEVPPEERAGK
jgi:hypothetical protein